MTGTFSNRGAAATVQPCLSSDSTESVPMPAHWIEIGLVGEGGTPLPKFEHEVTLPEGKKVRACLDESGMDRIENLETGGTAKIGFTTLDADASATAPRR